MDYDDGMPDFDYETYYDDVYDEISEEYLRDAKASYTLRDLWEDCLTPTVSDGVSAIFNVLMSCLLLRFTSTLGFLPPSVVHLSAGTLGIYCLHRLFDVDFLYVVAFGIIGYSSILLTHHANRKLCGIVSAVACVIFIISCELLFVERIVWHKIRGSQMVLAMKVISLSFDISRNEQFLPSSDQVFGYFFSVGTIVFGPWVSFTTYCRTMRHPSKNFSWAVRILICIILGFAYLTVSTCWSSYFLQSTTWRWLGAYRDALSFRSSHYFICYLSEALALASGISASNASWELPVAYPHKIEIPRSLVEVVICWNLPIHSWLKNYVFKTAKPLGNFVAVLLTYAASSILHGLNFQLAAVLLSLGFYTYIEHVLRKKLSDIFDACILARKCKKDCEHKHRYLHPYVLVTNISFGILAMFHLAYLGVMFDSSSSSQEEGYNMWHTLGKWSELNFASHWVALATYVFYFLI